MCGVLVKSENRKHNNSQINVLESTTKLMSFLTKPRNATLNTTPLLLTTVTQILPIKEKKKKKV